MVQLVPPFCCDGANGTDGLWGQVSHSKDHCICPLCVGLAELVLAPLQGDSLLPSLPRAPFLPISEVHLALHPGTRTGAVARQASGHAPRRPRPATGSVPALSAPLHLTTQHPEVLGELRVN